MIRRMLNANEECWYLNLEADIHHCTKYDLQNLSIRVEPFIKKFDQSNESIRMCGGTSSNFTALRFKAVEK